MYSTYCTCIKLICYLSSTVLYDAKNTSSNAQEALEQMIKKVRLYYVHFRAVCTYVRVCVFVCLDVLIQSTK